MAKNLTNFNEFQNKRKGINESKVNESLVGDVMRQTTIVDVPVSLLKAFGTKVKNETGTDIHNQWSDEILANEIIKYIISNFMNIENLPISILTGDKSAQGQPQAQPQAQIVQPPQAQQQIQPIQPAPQAQQVPPATAQNVQQTAQQIPATETNS